MPEAFRVADGVGVLDPLRDDGYCVRTIALRRARREGSGGPATCARGACGSSRSAAGFRCTTARAPDRSRVPRSGGRTQGARVPVRVGDTDVDVIGVHASSKLWYAGPIQHLRALRASSDRHRARRCSRATSTSGGPASSGCFRVAARGARAHLARAPAAQPDRPHPRERRIEVLAGEVLPAAVPTTGPCAPGCVAAGGR